MFDGTYMEIYNTRMRNARADTANMPKRMLTQVVEM